MNVSNDFVIVAESGMASDQVISGDLMVAVLYIIVIGYLHHLVLVLLFLRDFVQGKLLLLMVIYCCLCV